MVELLDEKRLQLVERLAEVDDEIAELFLMEEDPTEEALVAAIRRATLALDFVPVFMGSAFKNRGVQPLSDIHPLRRPCAHACAAANYSGE